MTKVFVSGVFDMLHSGHVEFLRRAAEHGDLHVSVGSDSTVRDLKGRRPIYSEHERLHLVRSLKYVERAFIASGTGKCDFEEELNAVKPDLLLVNHDGDTPQKRALCDRLGIDYRVLDRSPARGLPRRSTSEIRAKARMPYRIDLAGGWLDQPWVSSVVAGPVITASVEPTCEFLSRGGMATSTRDQALRLWGADLPLGEPQELAKILFACDNWPGRDHVSGSQDALGIVLPGVNRLAYGGHYWPDDIRSSTDESVLIWLERHIRLLPLFPRAPEFSVLSEVNVRKRFVSDLSQAAMNCWDAILAADLTRFAAAVTASFDAQVAMFPRMANDPIERAMHEQGQQALGMKISGAGGGGYLILVVPEATDTGIPLRIRRP
ncbi:MAG: adenylyltransferase/cytidyltransferase family protein [Planctomycetes bacterium]|nr:adenylyltransferase/cytidyltransferase family protein [Planctomycetota bacterium]